MVWALLIYSANLQLCLAGCDGLCLYTVYSRRRRLLYSILVFSEQSNAVSAAHYKYTKTQQNVNVKLNLCLISSLIKKSIFQAL